MSALQMLTTEITKLLSIGQLTDKVLVFQLQKASSCYLLLIVMALCFFICFFKLPDCVQEKLHCLQAKGFSPVWVRMCTFKSLAVMHL